MQNNTKGIGFTITQEGWAIDVNYKLMRGMQENARGTQENTVLGLKSNHL